MIGTTEMIISKEQMMEIVEYYLNNHLFLLTKHKSKVVEQVRKSGERFVITFEGEPVKAERPKPLDSDLSRPSTEANGGATLLRSEGSIAETNELGAV